MELSDDTPSSCLTATPHVKFWRSKSPWIPVETALNKDFFVEVCADPNRIMMNKTINVYHYDVHGQSRCPRLDAIVQLRFENRCIRVIPASFPSGFYSFMGFSSWSSFMTTCLLPPLRLTDYVFLTLSVAITLRLSHCTP
jgi:hypothetical protein